uniref:Uncharacterized protein n=1 Tax=Rhizophora mucronata TaxID=61149 RepID=A0A2P2P1T6_RHIMU
MGFSWILNFVSINKKPKACGNLTGNRNFLDAEDYHVICGR